MLRASVLLFAATALADQTADAYLDRLVKDLNQAISKGNYIAVSNACESLKEMQPQFATKVFDKPVQTLAKGIRHRDMSIAVVCVKTLGRLRHPGSARYLSSLLAVPRKVKAERWGLHLAALEAAGAIHDMSVVAKIEKTLGHAKTDFAVAAAKAFAGYAGNKPMERATLVGRMADSLGRLEKKKASKPADNIRLAVVKQTLLDSIRTVAGKTDLADADTARVWAREEKQRLKDKK